MAYDYRDPAVRAKAHAAASLLGEPAASELRAALDALDAADAEAKQASALRAALVEVYRILAEDEPADDALDALGEYTADEARHVKRLLAEARGRGVSDTPRIPDMLSRIGQWRDFSIEELDAAFGTVEGEIARLEAELAETRLRLAIWSGEGVPEGWEAAADGDPYIVRTVGKRRARVAPDGRWDAIGTTLDGPGRRVHPDPRPVLEALAAAEAWLAGVAP